MGSYPKTIAIDFDGVIHKYSKGWQDGSIYDKPVSGVFDAIETLFDVGYSVFIFSTRSPKQIKKWMEENCYASEYELMGMGNDPRPSKNYTTYSFTIEIIPFWKKFWNKHYVVGVTKRKLPAHCYIDDRALRFEGNWQDTLTDIQFFKTYQNGKV